jgi:hypothetical protein
MDESQKPVSSPIDNDNLNEDEPMPTQGSQMNETPDIAQEGTVGESEGEPEDPERSMPEILSDKPEDEETAGEPMEESSEETAEEPMEESSQESPEEVQEEETKEESVISETKPEKAQSVLKKASNFRQKLTKTKRKLASLDDSQKEKIRSDLVNEFVSILKLYKHKTTRKKYIRRLNGLRTAFNQSLNKLNGTTRQRRRKSKKQQPVVYSQDTNPEPEEASSEEEPSGNPL